MKHRYPTPVTSLLSHHLFRERTLDSVHKMIQLMEMRVKDETACFNGSYTNGPIQASVDNSALSNTPACSGPIFDRGTIPNRTHHTSENMSNVYPELIRVIGEHHQTCETTTTGTYASTFRATDAPNAAVSVRTSDGRTWTSHPMRQDGRLTTGRRSAKRSVT